MSDLTPHERDLAADRIGDAPPPQYDATLHCPSPDHPDGRWANHTGWAAPVWHDATYGTPVHLYDITHTTVPAAVRRRAVLALRRLVDPDDTGPRPRSMREGR